MADARIRRISIIIEQVRSVIGNTLRVLNGVKDDPTTEVGSVEYELKFKRLEKEIKYQLSYILPKEKIETIYEDKYFPEIASKVIDGYLLTDKLIKDNLVDLKIPLDNNELLKTAAQEIFNDTTLHELDFDKFDKIITTGLKNQVPFNDPSEIVNGTFTIGYQCPSGADDCSTTTSTCDDCSLVETIGNFITKQVVCIGKAFGKYLFAKALEPIVNMSHYLNIEAEHKNVAKAAYLGSISQVTAMIALMSPPIGFVLGGLLTSIIITDVYKWLASKYCILSKSSSNSRDPVYKKVCIDNNIFISSIYKVTYNSEDKYFQDSSVKFNDDGTVTVKWDDGSSISEISSSEYIQYRTYSIFQYQPYYVMNDEVSGDEITIDDLNSYLEKTDDATGEIKQDNGEPILIGISSDTSSSTCVQNTQNVMAFMPLLISDMILNPRKYGITDPADVMGYISIKSDFMMMKTIGELAAITANADDEILKQLNRLSISYNKKSNELVSMLERKTNDKLINFEDYLSQLGASSKLYGPAMSVVSEALIVFYEDMRQLLTKEQLIEVACCLLGELIDDAVENISKQDIELTLENIVNEINKFIDYYSTMLKMGRKLLLSDYAQIINKLFDMGKGFLMGLMGNLVGQFYSMVMNAIRGLDLTPDSKYIRCLPFDILKDLVISIVGMLFGKFRQAMTYILEQINLSIQGKDYELSRIAFLTVINELINILAELKLKPGDLTKCLEMNENINNNNDINIKHTGVIYNSDTMKKFQTGNFDDLDINDDILKSYSDKILLYRASQGAGYPIYLNKNKFADLITNVIKGDPIAVQKYINDKKKLEIFNERRHSNSKLTTVKDILNYYKVR